MTVIRFGTCLIVLCLAGCNSEVEPFAMNPPSESDDGLPQDAAEFVKRREQLLNSDDSIRAFASGPSSDVIELKRGKDNSAAYDRLKAKGLSLVRVHDGRSASLADFANGTLVFVTQWDPYSAQTIGSTRRLVDSGALEKLGLVYFENTGLRH